MKKDTYLPFLFSYNIFLWKFLELSIRYLNYKEMHDLKTKAIIESFSEL